MLAEAAHDEVWMLILTIAGIAISLGIGLVAVYYARRSASYASQSVTLTQQGLEVQNRQLQLQEEQAAMIPRLEVSDVRFFRPRDSSEVREILREVEQNRRQEEQEGVEEEERKRNYDEWERQQKEKEKERQNDPLDRSKRLDSFGIKDRNPHEKSMTHMLDPTRYGGHRYDGPKPNAVLDLQIINKGKTAAHDISGTVSLEASCLHPLDFPVMDDRGISGPDEGFFKVELVRVPELLPGHTAEYRIALQAKYPGNDNKVQVQYEFITPGGINLKDEKAVEWVHSSPQR